jgi:hypothetical protein
MRIVEFRNISGADDNRYATFVSAGDVRAHHRFMITMRTRHPRCGSFRETAYAPARIVIRDL